VLDLWGDVNVPPVVLACDDVHCVVLGATEAMSYTLAPLPGMDISLDAQPERIVPARSSGYCAYGAALYCQAEQLLDASPGPMEWVVDLPPEFGTRFIYVNYPYSDYTTLMAATDQGALIQWNTGADWEELIPPGDQITSIASYGSELAVLHQSGKWWSWYRYGAMQSECTQQTSLLGTALFYNSAYYGALATTVEGEIFRRFQRPENWPGGPTEWCKVDQNTVLGGDRAV
jgi:hypothetical protein